MLLFHEWLMAWILRNQCDVACIEFLSVERNAQTTRLVSQYQAAAAIACKRQGLLTIEARVTSARKAALGNGSMSKDKAFAAVKKIFPDHDFGRFDQGGGDKADATVLALAALSIAEHS